MRIEGMSGEELLSQHGPGIAGPSFAEFYRRHEAAVLAFHLRRTHDPETAADLTAETFVCALEGRARFRAVDDHAAVRWLFGIAGHVGSRHRRVRASEARRFTRLTLERPPLNELQLTETERLIENAGLARALQSLPPDQAQAVTAYVVGDQSYDELADDLQASPATIRKRVSRGMRTLRNALEGET